jgi:hypothetical protein
MENQLILWDCCLSVNVEIEIFITVFRQAVWESGIAGTV